MASVDAALLLFKYLTAKLTSYTSHYLEVLKKSMTIILLSLTRLDQYVPDRNKKITEVLEKAARILQDWIVNKNVIGGSSFGGKVRDGGAMLELEVCTYILCILQTA